MTLGHSEAAFGGSVCVVPVPGVNGHARAQGSHGVRDNELEIRTGEVHLWLAGYDAIDALAPLYRRLMSDRERRQEARFHFSADRRRYLVTRALTRTVLSRYFDVEPDEWEFDANECGRPFVANDLSAVADISFNISHTRNLIALAIARGRTIGVDIEHVERRTYSLDVASRYFAASEYADLRRRPEQAREAAFFEYWTLKEAYLKARGYGLSIDLDQVRFLLQGRREIAVELNPDLDDNADSWEFGLLRPTARHVLALCASSSGFGGLEPLVRETVPLAWDCRIDVPVCRRSVRQPESSRSGPAAPRVEKHRG